MMPAHPASFDQPFRAFTTDQHIEQTVPMKMSQFSSVLIEEFDAAKPVNA